MMTPSAHSKILLIEEISDSQSRRRGSSSIPPLSMLSHSVRGRSSFQDLIPDISVIDFQEFSSI